MDVQHECCICLTTGAAVWVRSEDCSHQVCRSCIDTPDTDLGRCPFPSCRKPYNDASTHIVLSDGNTQRLPFFAVTRAVPPSGEVRASQHSEACPPMGEAPTQPRIKLSLTKHKLTEPQLYINCPDAASQSSSAQPPDYFRRIAKSRDGPSMANPSAPAPTDLQQAPSTTAAPRQSEEQSFSEMYAAYARRASEQAKALATSSSRLLDVGQHAFNGNAAPSGAAKEPPRKRPRRAATQNAAKHTGNTPSEVIDCDTTSPPRIGSSSADLLAAKPREIPSRAARDKATSSSTHPFTPLSMHQTANRTIIKMEKQGSPPQAVSSSQTPSANRSPVQRTASAAAPTRPLPVASDASPQPTLHRIPSAQGAPSTLGPTVPLDPSIASPPNSPGPSLATASPRPTMGYEQPGMTWDPLHPPPSAPGASPARPNPTLQSGSPCPSGKDHLGDMLRSPFVGSEAPTSQPLGTTPNKTEAAQGSHRSNASSKPQTRPLFFGASQSPVNIALLPVTPPQNASRSSVQDAFWAKLQSLKYPLNQSQIRSMVALVKKTPGPKECGQMVNKIRERLEQAKGVDRLAAWALLGELYAADVGTMRTDLLAVAGSHAGAFEAPGTCSSNPALQPQYDGLLQQWQKRFTTEDGLLKTLDRHIAIARDKHKGDMREAQLAAQHPGSSFSTEYKETLRKRIVLHIKPDSGAPDPGPDLLQRIEDTFLQALCGHNPNVQKHLSIDFSREDALLLKEVVQKEHREIAVKVAKGGTSLVDAVRKALQPYFRKGAITDRDVFKRIVKEAHEELLRQGIPAELDGPTLERVSNVTLGKAFEMAGPFDAPPQTKGPPGV